MKIYLKMKLSINREYISKMRLTLPVFLLLMTTLPGIWQVNAGTIARKITDVQDQALDNVNTTINGTSLGTVTDKDGQFSIRNLRPGSYAIQFSYIGYETELIEIIRKRLMNFIFDENQFKDKVEDLIDQISHKKIDPYTAADEILDKILK